MILYEAKDYSDLSRKAANILSAQVILSPSSVLGLATGSSPEGTYSQLIEWYKKGDVDFSKTIAINLDEYKGLSSSDSQSYAYFMKSKFFDHINIKKENTYIPNGLEEDSKKECERYNNIIKSLGGIDLQLLGIGGNGHIGFNEPGESFEKETHCIKLADETIEANSRFFSDLSQVPKYAYSMGIKNIMQSKRILLIASGESKANALYLAMYGPITSNVPASILQLHNNVIIVADRAALKVIKEKGLI